MAKGKIIVMRLFGGLENQLFQYAFLFALSRQGGKARLEASSYEHDDKRVCELHHFRVSLPIEGGPPPWAFRKSRIPACLRSLFAAPKYPHFREEKRHGFDPGVFTEKGEIFRLFLEDRITGVVWSKLFRRILPGCSAPPEVRLPSSFTSGEDTLYVSRAIARCRSVALTSEKLYHYGLGGPQSVSSRNRKAETRPASYYAVFEMLTREKLREGVLGSNRTAYMNYIVPLLFPDNEMPAGRLRHWAELWREADITSEHVCGMPREQRAYLEAALAGRWIYLRLLQCFWKFKTARRKMFRLRFSKNGIDTLQILGYTLYSAKKLPRSSL